MLYKKNILNKNYIVEKTEIEEFENFIPIIESNDSTDFLSKEYNDLFNIHFKEQVFNIDEKFILKLTKKDNFEVHLINKLNRSIYGKRTLALLSFEDCMKFNNIVASGHSEIFHKESRGKGYGKEMYNFLDKHLPLSQIPYEYEKNGKLSALSPNAINFWIKRNKIIKLPEFHIENIKSLKETKKHYSYYKNHLSSLPSEEEIEIFIEKMRYFNNVRVHKTNYNNRIKYSIDNGINLFNGPFYYGNVDEIDAILRKQINNSYSSNTIHDFKSFFENQSHLKYS